MGGWRGGRRSGSLGVRDDDGEKYRCRSEELWRRQWEETLQRNVRRLQSHLLTRQVNTLGSAAAAACQSQLRAADMEKGGKCVTVPESESWSQRAEVRVSHSSESGSDRCYNCIFFFLNVFNMLLFLSHYLHRSRKTVSCCQRNNVYIMLMLIRTKYKLSSKKKKTTTQWPK